MIPAVTFSAGLFLLVACVWAARVGQSAVAGIFGTFYDAMSTELAGRPLPMGNPIAR